MAEQVVPLHITIRPDQAAMIQTYQVDEGLLSVSEAVRRILTEWRRYKAAEVAPANQLPTAEVQTA